MGRATSLNILRAIAASADLKVHEADVEGAYLNGKITKEIYMEYPEGIEPTGSNNTLRLRGSLYGLKQSGLTWWIELGVGLEELGFMKLESDWGLYYRPSTALRGTIIVLAGQHCSCGPDNCRSPDGPRWTSKAVEDDRSG